jgi:hypothetical protein
MCFVNGKHFGFRHFDVLLLCGWGDRALQECNPSAQTVRELQESILRSGEAGPDFCF